MPLDIPAHVPDYLISDFDMTNVPLGQDDMQLAWRRALADRPLVYTPHQGGCWVVTRADDLEVLYADVTRLSNREIFFPAHAGERVLPGETDPPLHTELRKTVLGPLNATAIQGLEPRVRAYTIELIEALKPAGRCEFVDEFALKLPLVIFLELAGMPKSDRLRLRKMAENVARGETLALKNQGHHDLREYLGGWVTKRRAEPAEDLISHIMSHKVAGRDLTDDEVIGIATGIFLGRLDTVASALGFITRFLANNPDQRAYIRANFDKMTHIIDELFRRFSIVALGRIVAEDFEYKGVRLKKGDRVMLPTSLHGLDPLRFDHPEDVDYTRRGSILAFGRGAHACLGRPLARAELRIFLEEWLTRLPDFEVDGSDFYTMTGQVLALNRLPLKWAV